MGVPLHVSLKQQLQNDLVDTLAQVVHSTPIPVADTLPVYRVRQPNPIRYRSSLVRQWAKRWNYQPQTLVLNICEVSGWQPGEAPLSLDWVWSAAAIAAWLSQRYAEAWTALPPGQMAESLGLEISVQYTLQRWSDLLILARREYDLTPPLPWSALTAADAEWIAALLDFGDRLASPPLPPTARLTLCQASLDYYQDHRIWGEARPLAQARWGLMAIAHHFIQKSY